jgi:hypothetical protein
MRIISIFLLLSAAIASSNCGVRPKVNSPCADALAGTLWMSVDDVWKKPPEYTGNPSRYAPVHLLRFSADGSFAMIACWVNENRGELHIMSGDGQAVFQGTWRAGDWDHVDIDYSLVTETVMRPTVKYPTSTERHRLTCLRSRSNVTTLKEPHFDYRPIGGLKMTEFEEYLPARR